MTRLAVISLHVLLIFTACKKSGGGAPERTVTIKVLSGNDQSDTAGRVLPNALEISVTHNGTPLANAQIKIVQPNCSYADSSFVATGLSGTVVYSWTLNGQIGTQTLKLYAVDSLGRVLDSTTASATGLFFDHTWLPSACLPGNGSSFAVVELSTGRLLLGGQVTYYSDDSGRSWSALASFPPNQTVLSMAVYQHTVFAGTIDSNHPLYISSDNGLTWQSSAGLAGFSQVDYLSATKSGKVFASSQGQIYMSADLGQTWKNLSTQASPLPSFYAPVFDFCESADGTIFGGASDGDLWESEDGGTTWNNYIYFNGVQSCFSDVDGVIYVSTAGLQGQLFKMTGPGNSATWSPLCSFANAPGQDADIANMMEVNDTFYFSLAGYGLMKTTDFTRFQQIYSSPYSSIFLLTKEGVGITYSQPNGGQIIYNVNP